MHFIELRFILFFTTRLMKKESLSPEVPSTSDNFYIFSADVHSFAMILTFQNNSKRITIMKPSSRSLANDQF